MSGNVEEKLTRNQVRAIAALIEHRSITAAADAIGITDRTIYRYLEDASFRQELTKAEKGLIDSAGIRLLGGQDKALQALEDLIASNNLTNKRLAAVTWLNYVLKWRELRNVEDRLAELERRVFGHED